MATFTSSQLRTLRLASKKRERIRQGLCITISKLAETVCECAESGDTVSVEGIDLEVRTVTTRYRSLPILFASSADWPVDVRGEGIQFALNAAESYPERVVCLYDEEESVLVVPDRGVLLSVARHAVEIVNAFSELLESRCSEEEGTATAEDQGDAEVDLDEEEDEEALEG